MFLRSLDVRNKVLERDIRFVFLKGDENKYSPYFESVLLGTFT